MNIRRLDLSSVYRAEAQRIVEARQRAQTLHATGDIKAAGGEVETAVRDVIAGRLPPRYRTTHGHILDYNGRTSSQLDVIIAENLASKSLFEASDRTEYIPYESVYAFGEIKSTYYKSQNPIQHFSDVLRNLNANLTRQTNVQHRLLTFMVFCSANDFNAADVEELYRNTTRDQLPSFICFLDLGTIVFSKFLPNGLGQPVPVQYHLTTASEASFDGNHKWSLIKWGQENDRTGSNLMFMHLALVQHLLECGVAVPNLHPYFALSLNWDNGEIFE